MSPYRENEYSKEGHFRTVLIDIRSDLHNLEPCISSSRGGSGFRQLSMVAAKIDKALEDMPKEPSPAEALGMARAERDFYKNGCEELRAERDFYKNGCEELRADLARERKHSTDALNSLRRRRWAWFRTELLLVAVALFVLGFLVGRS